MYWYFKENTQETIKTNFDTNVLSNSQNGDAIAGLKKKPHFSSIQHGKF